MYVCFVSEYWNLCLCTTCQKRTAAQWRLPGKRCFARFFFVFVWNPQASAPITSGTNTDGGAVMRKPGSACRKNQHLTLIFFHFFGLESTQLVCRVQSERAQVEEQYWGNPKVARLDSTPAILFWRRHSPTQIYIQTKNITQQTSAIAIEFKFFFLVWFGLGTTSKRAKDSRNAHRWFWFVMPPHS